MKKFLFSALLAIPFAMYAQNQTVDFEELTLTPDSYFNGSDLSGGFTTNDNLVHFVTEYDTAYGGMWTSGFAYSNMQDDSTAGFMNQYSAIPAKGANNSANYAVFTPGYGVAPMITFEHPSDVSKISITNTTYAYLSMKDGDAFGKKFGASVGADGEDDGTEGKDYFFVRIFAHNAAGMKVDSLDSYLADFRSTDTTAHYILDTWKEVSLSFSSINSLSFELYSSDNGEYSMNTPAYFAIDNIEFKSHVSSVTEIAQTPISIYPNPTTGQLNINNYEGVVSIFAMNGTLVKSLEVTEGTTIDISDLTEGVYQLVTTSSVVRFVKM